MAKIITFDGHDGAGKTTLINLLRESFTDEGVSVSALRALDGQFDSYRSTNPHEQKNIWFYISAWLDAEKRIEKAKQENDLILVDRSYFSTYVLAKAFNLQFPEFLLDRFLQPDLAVQVVVDEKERVRRINGNSNANGHDKSSINCNGLIERANKYYKDLGLYSVDNSGSINTATQSLRKKILGL